MKSDLLVGENSPAPANPARCLHSFPAADCTVEVFASWRALAPEVWPGIFTGRCKDHRYYEIVEETLGDQFEHRYCVVRNPAGEMAVQPFFIVRQDLLAGLQGRLGKVLAWIRRRWPNCLKPRMLMVGCSAGEGQLGSSESWAVRALHAAVQEIARREKISILLFKDFPAEFRQPLGYLTEHGYGRVPSMPGARLNIAGRDFEEFMQNELSKVFRKNLRRKFKASAEFGALTMEVVNDITPLAAEIQLLYQQTHDRSPMKFECLTPDYFRMLGQRMPDRTRFFLWRQAGRLVAFALCLVQNDTIYDLNVGLDYRVALDLHLYFVTFRDLFNWAAANGIKHYSTGPLNYDPKLHLQLELEPLDLYARHANPMINVFFKVALKYLEPARHDPAIRKFRNFQDLY